VADGATQEQARSQIWLVDTGGLLGASAGPALPAVDEPGAVNVRGVISLARQFSRDY
jgi:hypothetical protein